MEDRGRPGGTRVEVRTIKGQSLVLTDRGLIRAHGPLLHVFPSLSHTFLSYSTIKTINLYRKKNNNKIKIVKNRVENK